jgi:hypothetical protein
MANKSAFLQSAHIVMLIHTIKLHAESNFIHPTKAPFSTVAVWFQNQILQTQFLFNGKVREHIVGRSNVQVRSGLSESIKFDL